MRDGGALYVSGDVSYDENRNLTRESRLTELCGVKAVSRRPIGPGGPVPPEVSSAGAVFKRPFWVYKLGKGTVYYLPQNLENLDIRQKPDWDEEADGKVRSSATTAECSKVYRAFFNAAGLMPLVSGGTAQTRCWVRHTTDGGAVYTLLNGDSNGRQKLELPTRAGVFSLEVSAARPAMVWVDGKKRVRAILAEGSPTLTERRSSPQVSFR